MRVQVEVLGQDFLKMLGRIESKFSRLAMVVLGDQSVRLAGEVCE